MLVDSVDKRLKEIIDQSVKGLDWVVLELVVRPDPVHTLCEVDPEVGVHRSVRRVKGGSSGLLCQEFPRSESRLPASWTHSYFVSTVDGVPTAIMKQYIDNQKMV